MEHRRKILYIFTRTPLHVGAGSSVGAIDQPIQRERHTGFPVIPGTALKGVLADEEPYLCRNGQGKFERTDLGRDIFGDERTDNEQAKSGSMSFGEGKLLAFPVRSGRGCFAWLTCPLILRRWNRDAGRELAAPPEPVKNDAYFDKKTLGETAIFEDYTYSWKGSFPNTNGEGKWLDELTHAFNDPVWRDSCPRHLVLISDETMAHFARTANEVAQHVKIDDDKGTQVYGALFNQENVSSETLFYAPVTELRSNILGELKVPPVIQIGGDGTTGLGYCTAQIEQQDKASV
ncbi:MAG: type III-B CRISPR module RAMP protein Cmr4 [Verrucomicrobia bacterium]|nr:type III-B CRISPR module RAMP protein Cmr4 [Verrucomicrobiota bacterium]